MAYNGAAFDGWQSQPSGNAVQDHLEKALTTALREEIKVTGASRTDAGVHALQQVATFRTAKEIDIFRVMGSLKGLLPESVGIQKIAPVDASFHPITSAVGKAYRYRFWRDSRRHPFYHSTSWSVGPAIDVDTMREAASAYLGVHDFSSHCAADSSAKTKEREIFWVELRESGPTLDLWVAGGGFLKQMVRTMAGTLLEIGAGKRDGNAIPEILASGDRSQAGITAPAAGLSLMKIFYNEIETLDSVLASLTW